MQKSFYNEYINSNKWRNKRNKLGSILRKSNDRKCIICGCKNGLQLHHITYKNLSNEELGDLFFICGKHHKQLHFENGKKLHKGENYLLNKLIFMKNEFKKSRKRKRFSISQLWKIYRGSETWHK